MSSPSPVIKWLQWPHYQALLVVILIIVFSGVDKLMPRNDEFFDADAGPWIMATAMVFSFILLNVLMALREKSVRTYWGRSVIFSVGPTGIQLSLVLSPDRKPHR